MPNVQNNIIIQNWYSGTQYTYNMYDVVAGININNVSHYGPPYTSTIDNNINNNPSGQFIYAINTYQRSNDIATISLTFTGIQPNYARGSLYAITGLPDTYINATGMVLNAIPNGGNSILVEFINPGPPVGTTSTSIGAINSPEPSWTTGFFWTPGYTTPWSVDQSVITAAFDSNYQQRQPQGITPNVSTWSLGFENRTDREAKSIMVFVQNLAAVYSTTILIPVNHLYNNPNLKYVLGGPKIQPTTYNQNNITVTAKQVNEF